jgi:hypothetical protein
MKSCATCNRTYTDASLNFCLEDGTPLTISAPGSAASDFDPNATIHYPESHETKPPQGEAYRPPTPAVGSVTSQTPTPPVYQMPAQGSSFGRQQGWTAPGAVVPRRKSNAIWWILGGLFVLGIILVGAVIMILALASMGSNSNANANRANVNSRVANRNANSNTTNTSNTNSNANLPASLSDDFSDQKWGTGNYAFGDIWYADDEYHMRAKEKTYLVMYAPSSDYTTANAAVRVTARSVDGTPAASGFGLVVHGEKSKTGQLEDYALLIYTGNEPKYEIIKHKGGVQTELVPWASSRVIRTGANPNQLEVRAKGSELSFYINGQYVDRITDTENFKGGIAGLYTSDTAEVAFDDLEIKR